MNAAFETDALILLVDDEEAVRRIAARSLERLGYRVLEAADGRAALEILETYAHTIDLILTDVRMPRLSGDELAHIASRRWPDIPVVLTSGHARTGDFTESGLILPVLPKPYSRAALAETISTALGGPSRGGWLG